MAKKKSKKTKQTVKLNFQKEIKVY